MRAVERAGLRLLVFDLLEEAGLACVHSTRPLDVGRDEDLRRLVAAAGLDPARTARPRQVHHATVLEATGPLPEPTLADGLVTDRPGLALSVRAADCSLIVVADPARRAVGVAHAGWKGSARGVVVRLVEALCQRYDCRPQDLLAGVGPTIGLPRYPVGPEVPSAFLRLRRWASACVHPIGGKLHFDLAAANVRFLEECGIAPRRIERSGLCTCDNPELLHSFRRDGTRAGHHGLVAGWPE